MLEHGLLERRGPLPTIAEVLAYKHSGDGASRPRRLRGAPEDRRGDRADAALRDLAAARRPRAPAESLTDVIGSLNERGLLDRIFRDPDALGEDVTGAMDPPLHAVERPTRSTRSTPISATSGRRCVVVRDGKPEAVLTRSDLLEYLAHRRSAGRARLRLARQRDRPARGARRHRAPRRRPVVALEDMAQGGPQPVECLGTAADGDARVVMGNSDAVLLDRRLGAGAAPSGTCPARLDARAALDP